MRLMCLVSSKSYGGEDLHCKCLSLNHFGLLLMHDYRKDDNAVDKSNKMFVRMKFIKALSPTKGKNVKQQEAGGHMKKPKPAFLDLPEGFDESSVLQPCLYKIR